MTVQTFQRRSLMPASANDLFAWHARPGAFERLSPPWQAMTVIRPPEGIEVGTEAEIAIGAGPIKVRWLARHDDYVAGRRFRDVQVKGPFASWVHTHEMEPIGPASSFLEDRIGYELPLGALGRLLGGRHVRKQLEQTFAYRHRVTEQDLRLHAKTLGAPPMKILITGATGLIGRSLTAFLESGGHIVSRVTRSPSRRGDILWDPANGILDAEQLEGFDAVVHFAGENVGEGRWSDQKKARIRDSRAQGTKLLAETLAGLTNKPKVLVSASATGIYGSRGDEVLTEDSAPGDDFLAEVCNVWEKATAPAREAGIRVVNPRFGVVLSPAGGALKKMLTPFKMGAGGRLGDGDQYMPWIALDDTVGLIHHAILTEGVEGPVNAVAPEQITNLQYTKALGSALGRPTIFPMPAFIARVAFGEMADALLLSSARVSAAKLESSGYNFLWPEIEGALRHLLGRFEAAA